MGVGGKFLWIFFFFSQMEANSSAESEFAGGGKEKFEIVT